MGKKNLRDAGEMVKECEMTIRRELVSCAGSVILLGGYIGKDPKTQAQKGNRSYEQQEKNTAEKMYLGKRAASLIEDGEGVFFDCGSTVPFISTQINDDIKFTTLFCSIIAILALQEKPDRDLILCGGRY
ncbi:DNA-binding transcriptional repressor DeoR, partial [Pasteurella multocida]|nr:DNA-binding transcriptional repressor DeoR [Pasteurella multocida]